MTKFLFLAFIFTFSVTLSAQKSLSGSASDLQKNDKVEAVSKKQKSDLTGQIKKALMNDSDVQNSTIDYLKSNPNTIKSLTSILSKNKGSNKGIMKSILGDKKLSAAAIEYVRKNPELLKKAMKFVGM